MSLTSVFLTGLLAGGASCAAVQGGLLAGLVARHQDGAESPPAVRRGGATQATKARRVPTKPIHTVLADDLAPVSGFLAGKLVSHTLLGAATDQPSWTALRVTRAAVTGNRCKILAR